MSLSLLACLVPAVAPVGPPAQEDTSAAREAAFVELLTDARMVGSFTLTGEETPTLHEDSYSIQGVSKLMDGSWQFVAAVEYRDQAVPVALSVSVEWIGDTPMLSVTDLAIPLLGTYSARVLFYEGQYAGVWSGDGYGGQMFGRIERAASRGDEGQPEDAERDEDGGQGTKSSSRERVPDDGTSWPSFRGPDASGVSDEYATPVEWNVETGENVKWRTAVPGLSHSSPVIWGDRLFLTTAIRHDGEQELLVGLYGDIAPVEDDSEFSFELHCYDKHSGELLWRRSSWNGVPAIKRHTKGSHASSSPATDGRRVLAFYGSEGLYAYDLAGELLWKKDFGVLDSGFYMVPSAQWGFSSSPVLFEDRVFVQCDVQGQSFVACLDADSGEELWRTERDEVPGWSTPTIDVSGGRRQLICNGYKHIGSYDLDTGEELWRVASGGDIPVPTPVVSHGKVFITNAHGRMAPILAVDLAAEGELGIDAEESEYMAWSTTRGGNYMQTPLAYGEEIYFCSDAGILACYDVHTGEQYFRERLGAGRTGFTGSGVAADGKLYFTSEEGDVYVVSPGIFEVLAVNPLGEEFMSTPAVSAGVLYFRARGHLVAVGE